MAERTALIARKNEVIRELAAARRRLDAARQAPDRRQMPQIAFWEAEMARLQAEEHRLRLAIDRTPRSAARPRSGLLTGQRTQTTMQAKAHPPFDALITAGYNPAKADALAQTAGVHHKALIPIAGKPMIWHVVRALMESGLAGEIVIVGLGPEHGIDFGDASVHYVPNQPSLWASQNAGLSKLKDLNAEDRIVMACGADAPLLTGKIVRSFVDACRPFDRAIYWGIVPQNVMEATFPGSKRSYLPLREGKFCSGDLYLGWLSAGLQVQEQARYFIANRKHVVKQVWKLGLGPLLRLLFHRLSIDELLHIAEHTLGVVGGPVILPYAEAGMDVDKPHQLEMVRAYLRAHPDHPANTRSL